MKNNVYLYSLAAGIILFVSCNGGGEKVASTKTDSTGHQEKKTSTKNWAPPQDLPISFADAQKLITNFQTTVNPNPAPRNPSSFLLNCSDLRKYFRTVSANINPYLHIYFAATDTSAKNVFLVLVGTFASDTGFFHDSTMNMIIYSDPAFSGARCGTTYDRNLDGPDKYVGTVNQCRSLIKDKSQFSADIKKWLKNYQIKYPQPNHTQSFIINANSLKSYLLDMNSTVQYLHVYIGYKPGNEAPDNLALVIIGIDGTGVTVPWNNNTAFDEVMPCPKCNAVLDAFDGDRQK